MSEEGESSRSLLIRYDGKESLVSCHEMLMIFGR